MGYTRRFWPGSEKSREMGSWGVGQMGRGGEGEMLSQEGLAPQRLEATQSAGVNRPSRLSIACLTEHCLPD